MERLAEGWALSRAKPPPVREGAALRIEVGDPDQVRRYVFPNPPEGVPEIAARVREPHVFFKLPVREPNVREMLPQGWRAERTGTVMTLRALPDPPTSMPTGYRLTLSDEGGVTLAQAMTNTGELAAQGRVVVIDGLAVHERIRTERAHERRQLGRAVMTALGASARERGAASGALVATAAGVLLYRTLGWVERAPYVTAEWSALTA